MTIFSELELPCMLAEINRYGINISKILNKSTDYIHTEEKVI